MKKELKIILIILGTIFLLLCIAGSIENSYYYYKTEQPPISFTQYYLGQHWKDTDAEKDPNSAFYRGF